MKLVAAAIVLFSSTTTSVAGNFTPIPKNKIVQNTCFDRCQGEFELCLRLSGTNSICNGPFMNPSAKRCCDLEQNICQTKCQRGLGG